MRYDNIYRAEFISRPNRFIANISINGDEQVCHVKNTGRCRELLIPGAEILVQRCDAPGRKTQWDLISVYKGERLINMDSAAPNKIFGEYVKSGAFMGEVSLIRPEKVWGDSRLDFYIEAGQRRGFAEVKGVTLEDNGVVRFPDAPTLRGTRHLHTLAECVKAGFEAWAVFIVQMEGVEYLEPNRKTDPDFAMALEQAHTAGVNILALDCRVTESEIWAASPVPVRI